jgi:hypothetical protein
MKLHIPGLPQIVQYAFDKLLNKGIGWDNLSDDVRGVLVGIVFDSTIPLGGVPGFIPALGATYLRADYPYFWSRIQAGGNIVNDSAWQTGKRYGSYSYGDGKTTFRVPFIVDFVRGFSPTSGQTMGQWRQDQMQRIMGTFDTRKRDTSEASMCIAPSGAFTIQDVDLSAFTVSFATDQTPRTRVTLDSANSPNARTSETTDGETWPCHVLLPKYIYTGEVW